MELKCVLVDESHKYMFGEKVNFDPACVSAVTARRDWAAFQVLLQADDCLTLSIGNNTAFSPRMSILTNGIKVQYPNIRLSFRGRDRPVSNGPNTYPTCSNTIWSGSKKALRVSFLMTFRWLEIRISYIPRMMGDRC